MERVYNLDEHGAFSSAYGSIKNLMLQVFDWMMHVTIGEVPILYINLGFVLLITLFAILLPVLRNSGATELTSLGSRMWGGPSEAELREQRYAKYSQGRSEKREFEKRYREDNK